MQIELFISERVLKRQEWAIGLFLKRMNITLFKIANSIIMFDERMRERTVSRFSYRHLQCGIARNLRTLRDSVIIHRVIKYFTECKTRLHTQL